MTRIGLRARGVFIWMIAVASTLAGCAQILGDALDISLADDAGGADQHAPAVGADAMGTSDRGTSDAVATFDSRADVADAFFFDTTSDGHDAALGTSADASGDSVPDASDAAQDAPTQLGAGDGAVVSLTVTVIVYGPASVSLTSDPAGVSCSGPCTQTVNVVSGTTVSLAAKLAGGLARWQGACSAAASTCSLRVDSAASATLIVNGYNYAFNTSTQSNANLGGLAGADATCAAAAKAGGLPGTYRAWLSTPTTNARDRLSGARGWIRSDGAPIFDSLATLAAGQMFYPVSLDENGEQKLGDIWTGTGQDGNYDGFGSCKDWTSGNGADGYSVPGASSVESGGWSDGTNAAYCNYAAAGLYCFGIDLNAPLVVTRSSGRRAFVTKTVWDPSTGIAQADKLCALEAELGPDGGLTGTYAAMLAGDGVSAASRFDLTRRTWVRVDGIPIAASPADLATAKLTAAIDVEADGTYSTRQATVWTGAASPATTGTAATTCNGWTAGDGGGGDVGRENGLGFFLSNGGYATGCTSQYPIYCFEQ
jgi:hypothetical protein